MQRNILVVSKFIRNFAGRKNSVYPPINILRYMKHVKIMNLPDCDKLLYCSGSIAQQIGSMFVVDDERPDVVLSYPILSGGANSADGWMADGTECISTPVVCRKGQKISPQYFSKFVKRGMHEEVPTTAWELYHQLRENGSDLQLPVWASNKETIREYTIELEFHDFREEARCVSTDTSDFYFEVYYNRDDKEDLYGQLDSQLMDYINIVDTEELYCKLVFTTLQLDYADIVNRLNSEKIDTRFCDMYNPRQ